MQPHRPFKERLPGLAIGGLVVLAGAYLGLRNQRPAAPISIVTSPTANAIYQPDLTTRPKEVVVHVVGAIKNAQVLHLPPDSRVQDAISKAGGPKPEADLESLNLAAKLVDGTQLYVPTKNPQSAAQVAEPYRGGAQSAQPYRAKPTSGSPRGAKTPSGPVSLNTGSRAQLETIPGVGPSTAEAILNYRQEHGGFARIEEITEIRGIGPKKFAKMKKWLRL